MDSLFFQMPLDFPKQPPWEGWAQLEAASLMGPLLCLIPVKAKESRAAGHLEVRKWEALTAR